MGYFGYSSNRTQNTTVPLNNPTPKYSIFDKAKHFTSDRYLRKPSSEIGKLITDTYKMTIYYFPTNKDSTGILDNYKNPHKLSNIICKRSDIDYIFYYTSYDKSKTSCESNTDNCAGAGDKMYDTRKFIYNVVKMFNDFSTNRSDLTKLYGSERNALFKIIERYKIFQSTYNAYIIEFAAWMKSPSFQPKETLEQCISDIPTTIDFAPLPKYDNQFNPANPNNITQSDVQKLLTNAKPFLYDLNDFNTDVSNAPIVPKQLDKGTFSKLMSNRNTTCNVNFDYVVNQNNNSRRNNSSSSSSSGTMKLGFKSGGKRKRTRRNHKKKRQNKSKMRKRR
jgi:hypothetical protein